MFYSFSCVGHLSCSLAKEISIGDEKTIQAVIVPPTSVKSDTGVILTHGAGGDLYEEQISLLSLELARQGLVCMRFTYKAPQLNKRVEVYKKALVSTKQETFHDILMFFAC